MEYLGLGILVLALLVLLWRGKPGLSDTERRFPRWAHEASRTKLVGPPIVTVLTVGVLIWIGAQLFVRYFADDPTPPRPVQNPACAEAARLASHGATDSPSYVRARDACARAKR